MNRTILAIAIFCNISIACFSQKSVLLVPFNPNMYNNQACGDMIKQSGKSYDQVLLSLQNGLDSCIISACKDSLKIVSLLNNYAQNASGDLELIHGASDYYFTDRPNLVASKKNKNLFSDLQKDKKSKDSKSNNIEQGEINTKKEDLSNKFMNVRFQDIDFIHSMTTKYGVNYLVFITQFEILGDYSNPYKVGDNSYNNMIKVHYTIFKSDGLFKTGDYISASYPAKEASPGKICKNTLPEVARQISRQIN